MYRWFSPDVIAAMLMRRTDEKIVFKEFDSIVMQNMIHNLLLFCALTWPSYHVIVASCKVIRNPGNFGLWNPESTALESGIQLMGSGIQP